jgi:sterol desaturase/sphingolipid hydroxylase (fatty acid hydroxylase superfamily)
MAPLSDTRRVAADQLVTSTGGAAAPRAFGSYGTWLVAVVVTAGAAWLAVTGAEALSASRELGRTLWAAQGRLVGPVLLAVIILLFLAERRWPAVQRPALSPAHLVDGSYLLLFVLVGPFITTVNTGFAIEVERHAAFLMLGRLPLVPQAAVVGLIIVAMDGMNWVAHVGNHRSMALWRFHALHHSQEEMSVLTTFRTHPLTHASYVLAVVPALLLEASGTVPAAALIAYGCFVTLPHANLRWSFGPLGRVLVSPAYHRLHHSKEPIGGRTTVNFGFVLVCWDRLAGCAAFPAGGDPISTGIAGRTVPVEQDDATVGLGRLVAAQLWQPFEPAASNRTR